MRTILTIARNELADSIRSRRTAVLLLLYVAGAVAGTLLFVKALQKVEVQLAETLGVQAVKEAGNVTAALWKSQTFRRMVIGLAGDKDLAESLLSLTPLALFYGWLSFAFSPLLGVLTSGPRMAEEVWLGSVRFVLFRASRLSWCLGKFIGQALQLLLALFLSAAAAWCVGRLQMASFEPFATAQGMLIFVWKAWVYTLAYLGLASAVSLVCRSPNLATALSILALAVVAALSRLANYLAGDGWRRIWEALYQLTPHSHHDDLWRFDAAHFAPAVLYLLLIGIGYLLAGYAILRRKDV
jgi:ABC-type transport system involved in multi-copper enzyme maturation permease subunit